MSRKVTIVLVIVAAVALAGYLTMGRIQSNLERLALSPVQDVDLSTVPDGTYDGSHGVFPVSVEVRVTVQDHRMTRIELVNLTSPSPD
ncbi:MAG: hypothetical protein R6U70_02145 [Bacillota bacterium]